MTLSLADFASCSRLFDHTDVVQLSKVSTAAARDNLEANNVNNVFMVRMCSEEFVHAWRHKEQKRRLTGLDVEALDLKTLVVDPPRAGLDKDTEKLVAEFDRVVYVSCNPQTLHANLQSVRDTHEIRNFALFDQFPFTPHIECGVYLVKK
jgi:tRNA (uracil-5-)-methyltransferase